MREGQSGIEKITNEDMKSESRRIARRIQFVAPLIALAVTAIILGLGASIL
jgi:hypothetical protein